MSQLATAAPRTPSNDQTSTEPGAPLPMTRIPAANVQRLERRVSLAVTVIPFIGTLIAVPLLWGHGIKLADVMIFLALYCISGLGVTVGFHRMFTHRSFEGHKWVRGALAIAGSLALQGPVIRWVADHRRHHAFSDAPGDPHSPHLEEAQGLKGVISGLWHSHMGWFFDTENTKVSRFAPDLLKEPAMRKIDKLFPLWVAASLVVPALLGLVITRSWAGALTALIWGGLVRIFFLHHVTWSINSICHFYGKRPFRSEDHSTNNWLLSVVSFGEAWHNNHHAFPTSARHGLEKWQFDPSAAVIRFMERRGWVWNVKVPSQTQLMAKKI
ncbi:MAG: acyl-CoA desaturase [Actinomycetota bacterium]